MGPLAMCSAHNLVNKTYDVPETSFWDDQLLATKKHQVYDLNCALPDP
jgi:hypothetical protein